MAGRWGRLRRRWYYKQPRPCSSPAERLQQLQARFEKLTAPALPGLRFGCPSATTRCPTGLRVFDTLGGPAAIEAHVNALGRFLYEQVCSGRR